MTIEQAIRLLQEIILPYENHDHGILIEEARRVAISALRAQQERENPLTLKELRQMNGEPVWIIPNRGIAKWYLVDVANDCCSTCDMDVVDFELYGPQNISYGWLAYDHKPETINDANNDKEATCPEK
jgi:hypothetical protein